jgi:hypothetical protein
VPNIPNSSIGTVFPSPNIAWLMLLDLILNLKVYTGSNSHVLAITLIMANTIFIKSGVFLF